MDETEKRITICEREVEDGRPIRNIPNGEPITNTIQLRIFSGNSRYALEDGGRKS